MFDSSGRGRIPWRAAAYACFVRTTWVAFCEGTCSVPLGSPLGETSQLNIAGRRDTMTDCRS